MPPSSRGGAAAASLRASVLTKRCGDARAVHAGLLDGLRKLARRRHRTALRVAAILLYIAISIRLTQVIIYFRAGS